MYLADNYISCSHCCGIMGINKGTRSTAYSAVLLLFGYGQNNQETFFFLNLTEDTVLCSIDRPFLSLHILHTAVNHPYFSQLVGALSPVNHKGLHQG